MDKRDKMAMLTSRPNEMQAGIICSVLEDAGIESFTSVAGGVMANAEFGLSFVPTAIHVNEDDLERAQAVLESTREESVDLDWSEVDVGEPENEAMVDEAPEAVRRRAKRRKFFFLILSAIVIYLILIGILIIYSLIAWIWELV